MVKQLQDWAILFFIFSNFAREGVNSAGDDYS